MKTVLIDDLSHAQIQAIARSKGMTIGGFIAQAVCAELAKKSNQKILNGVLRNAKAAQAEPAN